MVLTEIALSSVVRAIADSPIDVTAIIIDYQSMPEPSFLVVLPSRISCAIETASASMINPKLSKRFFLVASSPMFIIRFVPPALAIVPSFFLFQQ